MSITTNIQPRSERGGGMKLKDKKITIQGVQYVSDKYGNRIKETFTVATVWAYFRQLPGNEIYRVTTQATEEVMFVINYRTDITTENVILYTGVQYNIVRVGVFEGYKSDLTLYCKK
jgi:SPP1 family predicted phage head-tail adaptor